MLHKGRKLVSDPSVWASSHRTVIRCCRAIKQVCIKVELFCINLELCCVGLVTANLWCGVLIAVSVWNYENTLMKTTDQLPSAFSLSR